MEISLFLAKFLGIILTVAGLGALINQRYYHEVWNEFVKQPALFVLSGLLDLAGGLLIVLFHNIWIHDWRVLITLVGWFLLVRGSLRVLFPAKVAELITNVVEKHSGVVNGVVVVFLIMGVFLVFKGFGM